MAFARYLSSKGEQRADAGGRPASSLLSLVPTWRAPPCLAPHLALQLQPERQAVEPPAQTRGHAGGHRVDPAGAVAAAATMRLAGVPLLPVCGLLA